LEFLREKEQAKQGSRYQWLLVTKMNPDGLALKQRTNGNGVDINRNFPAPNWVLDKKDNYCSGPHPRSEAETKALCELIETTNPYAVIHFHSWKPCLIATGELPEILSVFKAQSGLDVYEEKENETPGSLGDYCWQVHGIPVLCLEEAKGARIADVWPRFRKSFEELMKC
jgi:protein MpaA